MRLTNMKIFAVNLGTYIPIYVDFPGKLREIKILPRKYPANNNYWKCINSEGKMLIAYIRITLDFPHVSFPYVTKFS